jgi:hypothetical protein
MYTKRLETLHYYYDSFGGLSLQKDYNNNEASSLQQPAKDHNNAEA